MNKMHVTVFTVIAGLAAAPNSLAGVLPKDVLAVKDDFDKVGAKKCSQAMAETLHFLANGRPFMQTSQWATSGTNNSPISLDFMITGTKKDYSRVGAIYFSPIGDRCRGMYVYTIVAPSQNCKTYMQKTGFEGPDWKKEITKINGDGGEAYLLSLKNSPSLNFIFNDVAGGCALTKREPLNMDAGK